MFPVFSYLTLTCLVFGISRSVSRNEGQSRLSFYCLMEEAEYPILVS